MSCHNRCTHHSSSLPSRTLREEDDEKWKSVYSSPVSTVSWLAQTQGGNQAQIITLYLIMLISLDDPLLYDTANISDSTDLFNYGQCNVGQSLQWAEDVKLSADPGFMLRKTSQW